MTNIAVIYMGGTFGCIGDPLQPMLAAEFLIQLKKLNLQHQQQIEYFAAPSIKDSTELAATDWLLLADFIQQLSIQFQHFIIIHGTDTLCYASAFLHHIFKDKLHIILTGSQQPLLTRDGQELLENSDAWHNLNYSIQNIHTCPTGVYLAFADCLHIANQTYKQHTESFNGFISAKESTAPIYLKPEFVISESFIEKSKTLNLVNLYVMPNNAKQLIVTLQNFSQHPPHILILQGFGSGNLPYDASLEACLTEFINKGVWVIMSTQVLFGAITQKYATGSWLNNINLVFDPHYSQADLYARAVLLYLQYSDQKNWQQYWA